MQLTPALIDLLILIAGVHKSNISYSYHRCDTRSTKENNEVLIEKFPNAPLCCGIDGTLDIASYSCSNKQTLPQGLTTCNWKNKQSLLVSKLEVTLEGDKVENSTNFVCVGSMAEDKTFLGALTCKVAPKLRNCQNSLCRMIAKERVRVFKVASSTTRQHLTR